MGTAYVPDAPDGDDGEFLIVTGSSAGGIEALMRLVANLPPDIAAPVVVAQHLAPDHPSNLREILASRTPLSVELVESEARLRRATIYVIPPGCDIEVVDTHVEVRLRIRPGPKPSIDRFFASAAAAYGDRLIAIVLSGLGADGARGARAVKSAGGTVIVQDPGSAGFSSMPLSIPPTIVDFTANPEQMGKIVRDLVGSSDLPSGADEKRQLRTLLALLRERSGIDFTLYKTPMIMRRLSRLMVAGGFNSLAEYIVHLQRNPAEYQRLVTSFLIKVTEFFRDTALFETLRDEILPELVEAAAADARELRIWSAGTSTGEEAYSLAILCAEIARERAEKVNVRIFATDVDEQAINFARRGLYPADALRDVPEALVEPYFTRVDGYYEVGKYIRSMTVFGQHDLGKRAPFPRIDLVLCRNVLIYFTKDLQARALALFAFALRERGFLVLGKAETATPLPELFSICNAALKIYRREGERVLLPPARQFLDAASSLHSREEHSMQRRPEAPGGPQEVIASYLAGSVVGVVVVDASYDIVAINWAARSMLQIHGVAIGSDLIHLVPSMGAKLRGVIDAAIAGESIEPISLLTRDAVSGVDRWLQVYGFSQRTSGPGKDENVGLILVDVTRYERRIAEDRASRGQLEQTLHDQTQRMEELSARVNGMLAANQELTNINAELRKYNEQLLVSAEDAASSNEEIETLNEEMQATNEELETLNEELQATVEELNATNGELEARGAELERQSRARQSCNERSEERSKALARALDDRLSAPYAILLDGRLEYTSSLLGTLLDKNAGEGWWKTPPELTAESGERYVPTLRNLDGNVSVLTYERVV